MKCDKGIQCDWCEYRDFVAKDNTKEKPDDTCSPPDGKCPVKKNIKKCQLKWSQQAGCQWAKGDTIPNSTCMAKDTNPCRIRNAK